MRYLFFIIILFVNFTNAQIIKKSDNRTSTSDTLVVDKGGKDSLKIFKPTINDYQHYTQFSEKKIFDTVFTIDKSYQFTQYNNQDNFGKIQFANIGSGFQDLMFRVNKEQNLALL